MIHLKMKNIMKSRKTTDSTRRKGRDAQADPDEDYLDQDYDDYDNVSDSFAPFVTVAMTATATRSPMPRIA